MKSYLEIHRDCRSILDLGFPRSTLSIGLPAEPGVVVPPGSGVPVVEGLSGDYDSTPSPAVPVSAGVEGDYDAIGDIELILRPDPPQNLQVILEETPGGILYTTDFSEYEEETLPSDWSVFYQYTSAWKVVNDPTAVGGGSLFIDGSQNRRALLWNGRRYIDSRSYGRVRAGLYSGGSMGNGLIFRGSGIGTTNATGIVVSLWADRLQVVRYLNGNGQSMTSSPMSVTGNQWYDIKAEVIGENVRAKAWLSSDPEPGDWMIDQNDIGGVTERGDNGVFVFSGTNHWFDFFQTQDLEEI